tara:strand:+ start:63 stop:1490 length:1428 start_codon:yes stop_codon:yes gene_type:complete
MTLEDLVNENKASLLDAYDENITFTGEESIKIDDILEVKKLYITTSLDKKKQRQVLYILKRNDKAYFMNGHYGAEVPEEDIIEVFDNIISTFKIRNLSVDTEEEHYMEFEDFYYSGMQLNQEYYSNMVVDKSKIPFSGTLEEGHGLDAFKIKVTSEQASLDFIIPITGNAFDGTIYTPFGLGKHNIFISGIPTGGLDKNSQATSSAQPTESKEEPPEKNSSSKPKEDPTDNSKENSREQLNETSSENQSEVQTEASKDFDQADNKNVETTNSDSQIENTKESVKNKALEEEDGEIPVETPSSSNSEIPMMQFSVINIDSRTMRYRIPTNVINSSDVQINSTSQLITYQNNSEYTKSRALFTWMVENIAIDSDGETRRSNIQVFDEAVGSIEEINQLYVAFLRAIDIPARVVKGTNDGDVYFWTELYLNGSWIVSDVIEGVYIKSDDVVEHIPRSMFNINLEEFQKRFDLIQIMPY